MSRFDLGRFVESCETSIEELYGDYELVLNRWRDLLKRQDVYAPPVKRRLVHVYLSGANRSWDELKPAQLREIAERMKENIRDEPDDERNIRLWFNAERRLPTPDIDSAIERLAYWHARSGSLDATYYL